jgi:hypothetical protein
LKALADHPKMTSWGIDWLLKEIASALNPIQETNAKLLESLKKEYENESPRIGSVFLLYKNELNTYVRYCSNHEMFRQTIGDAKNKNKACLELLNNIRMTEPRVKLNDIEGFLIKPIQRICKYPLFFDVKPFFSLKYKKKKIK